MTGNFQKERLRPRIQRKRSRCEAQSKTAEPSFCPVFAISLKNDTLPYNTRVLHHDVLGLVVAPFDISISIVDISSLLKNMDIDVNMVIFENIDINIEKAILEIRNSLRYIDKGIIKISI